MYKQSNTMFLNKLSIPILNIKKISLFLLILSSGITGVGFNGEYKNPGDPLSPSNFLIFASICVSTLYSFSVKGFFYLYIQEVFLFLFLMTVSLIQFIFPQNDITFGLCVLRGIIVSLFVLISMRSINDEFVINFYKIFYRVSIFFSFIAFIQVIEAKNNIYLFAATENRYIFTLLDYVIFRANSMINDPNIFCMFLALGFAASCSLRLLSLKPSLFFQATILTAIFLTGSRTGLIGFACLGLYFFSKNIKKILTAKNIIFLLFFISICILFLFKGRSFNDNSTDERYRLIKFSLSYLSSPNGLTFSGFNAYRTAMIKQTGLNLVPHNLPLELLLNFGILGFLFMIFIIIKIFLSKNFKYNLWHSAPFFIVFFVFSMTLAVLSNIMLWLVLALFLTLCNTLILKKRTSLK